MIKTALTRAAVAAGAAGVLAALFATGTAGADNEYVGQTYADAANAIAQSGSRAKVAAKVGSFLPKERCMVVASRKANFLDGSGNNPGGVVLLHLNCNYMFALPGVPGASHASPEGRAAYDDAVKKAQEAQQQQQAEQQGGAEGQS